MALKVADCGHCCTPLKQHIRWVYRLQEEFFLQVSYSHSNSHSHSYCPAQAAHPLGVRPAGGVLPPGEFQSQTQSLRHGHSVVQSPRVDLAQTCTYLIAGGQGA
eukprot:5064974-Pyramimonas_sp.AAC.1